NRERREDDDQEHIPRTRLDDALEEEGTGRVRALERWSVGACVRIGGVGGHRRLGLLPAAGASARRSVGALERVAYGLFVPFWCSTLLTLPTLSTPTLLTR